MGDKLVGVGAMSMARGIADGKPVVPSDAGWAYVDPKERALKAILRDKVEDRIVPRIIYNL